MKLKPREMCMLLFALDEFSDSYYTVEEKKALMVMLATELNKQGWTSSLSRRLLQ